MINYKMCRWLVILLPLLITACGGSSGDSNNSSNSSNMSSSSSDSSSSQSSSSEPSNSSSTSSTSSISSSSSSSSSSSTSGEPMRVDSGLAARESNSECVAPARPSSELGSYAFEEVDDMPNGINGAIYLAQAPGVDDRYYILERPGRVKTFKVGDDDVTQTVDFSSQVVTSGEGGALGMAFHPNFADNPYVYIFLTASRQTYGITDNNVSMVSVVRRYTVSANGLDFTDPTDILAPLNSSDTRLNQRQTNHKGGWIGFSPIDGYLYITTGDQGGGAGSAPLSNDFYNPAIDPETLHGKILRIDVDGASPYAIPEDNPYANGGGTGEVFAMGFRNPWRASFDRLTGDLWVGDVGEVSAEEINRVEKGGNYGWPFREATLDRCNGCERGQQSIAPVVELPRNDGWIAVIGGYVYRGDAIPELQGRYIFGDYSRSGISTISYDNEGNASREDLISGGGTAPSFSEDNAGNIWQVRSGGFYRLARIADPDTSEFPQTLSATGCFNAENIRQTAPGVVPYTVNSPLWSDGAAKERYFALPNDTHIDIQENGQWAFPIGTVLIKTFLLQDTPVETRLFVRHEDGDWGGYSYEWNEAGTDAQLLASGKTKTVGGQMWRYPSRAQCMNCHTAPNDDPAAERVLGLETAQINGDLVYPGNLIANQIQTLATVDYFSEDPGPHGDLAQMTDPLDSDATLADRAHAYMHTNCANCHQPNGPGRGGMDFRYTTSLANGGYCNVNPAFGNFGVADARLLKPGDAAASIIPMRMQRTDIHRMPNLSVSVVDTEGVSVIEGWIESLQTCP